MKQRAQARSHLRVDGPRGVVFEPQHQLDAVGLRFRLAVAVLPHRPSQVARDGRRLSLDRRYS